jgi:hypothetical protein
MDLIVPVKQKINGFNGINFERLERKVGCERSGRYHR